MSTPIINGANGFFPGAGTAQANGTDVSMRQRIDLALQQVESQVQTVERPQVEDLVKPVLRINEIMKAYGIQFDLNASDSHVVTRVIEVESGEVIRQIPSEAVLRISERLDELVGVLVQEKA